MGRSVGRTAALLVMAVLLGACSGSSAGLKSEAEQTLGSTHGIIGRHDHFGLDGYRVKGNKPVHITGAKVVGVPIGMKVIKIQAVERDEGAGFLGAWDGEPIDSGYGAGLKFVPVTDVVFQPGDDFYQRYYIVVTVMATTSRHLVSMGIELQWKAGQSTGSAFFPYKVSLKVPKEPAGQS